MSEPCMKNKKHKRTTIQRTLSWVYYLPLYLAVAVVPHVYGLAAYHYTTLEQQIFRSKILNDVHLLWKSRALIALTLLAVVLFVHAIIKKKVKITFDTKTILILSMVVVTILSSILSPYQEEVYRGTQQRLEGMYIYLCYFTLLFIAMHYGKDRHFIRNTLTVLLGSVFIMSLITLLQFFGYDIYTMSFLKWVFFPKEVAARSAELISVQLGQGTVGSLFNANYSGVFMLMGILIGLAFLFDTKNKKAKLLYFILLAFSTFGLFTSNSEASMLACSISLPVLVYFKREQLLNNLAWFVGWVLVFIAELIISYQFNALDLGRQKYFYLLLLIASLIAFFLSYIKLSKQFTIRTTMVSLFMILLLSIPLVGYKVLPKATSPYTMEVLTIKHNEVRLKTADMPEELVLSYEDSNITFNGGENDTIAFDEQKGMVTITKNGKTIPIQIFQQQNTNAVIFKMVEYQIFLFFFDNEFYYAGGIHQYVDQEQTNAIKTSGLFSDNPYQFSARAYIWSRFIPVALDKPLLGHGADVFTLIFPQDDPLMKYNMYGSAQTMVDKPHNLYFDIVLNFGFVGFTIFLTTIILAIATAFTYESPESVLIITITIAILASGLFNDSILGISQIFYVLIGTMLAQKERPVSTALKQ